MARRRRYGKKHAAFLRKNRYRYEELLANQGGGCAICGRKPSAKRRLDLDHDHRRMFIRGLLCVRCNRALPGWIDPEWLEKAAQYLRDAEQHIGDKED